MPSASVGIAFMAKGVANSPWAASISPLEVVASVLAPGTRRYFAYCFRREAGPLLILALFSICQYLRYDAHRPQQAVGVVNLSPGL